MWDTTEPNCVPAGQDFARCVDLTHASWMLNHGAFSPGLAGEPKALALAGSTRLGYELYVSSAELVDSSVSGSLRVSVHIRNTGVAPFYYDWPVQLSALDSNNALAKTWTADWKLSTLLPAVTTTAWAWTQTSHGLEAGQYTVLLRVKNPLTNGVAFRFANETQDADLSGWLTLGRVTVMTNPAGPSLRGSRSLSGFDVNVSNAAPGTWTVQRTSDWQTWTPFLSTNTSTAEWSVTDEEPAPARYYRVVGSP
jgi:hypothetical protein